jgi:hypothetical protein
MLSIVMLSVVYTRNFVVVLVTNLPPGYKKFAENKAESSKVVMYLNLAADFFFFF